MDKSRNITWFLLFVAVWFFVAPRIFPNLFPKPAPKAAQQQAAAENKPNEIPAVVPGNNPDPAPPAEVLRHPHRTIVLGPKEGAENPDTYLRVALTTQGGAIESAELLDPRYTTLDRKHPLKVVGNPYAGAVAKEPTRQTLETSVPAIDAQLKAHNLTLDEADWEVVPGSESETGVTFRYRAPDGSLEVRKAYQIQKESFEKADFDPAGYMVKVDLTVENLTDNLVKTRYQMLGPAGLPLEDPENARTFVELKAGVIDDPTSPGAVTPTSPLLAAAVVKELDKANDSKDLSGLTIWSKPFRYVGADVQYFAALLVPRETQGVDNDKDGKPDLYFHDARPVILHRDTAYPERSAVSLEFTSTELEIPAKSSTTHKFDLFLGPKRSDLMDHLDARPVMNYGWWHRVSAALIWVLTFFHHTLNLPYWMCIILLTCCVRGVMFPISMKQTAGAAKMKEIQPELTELRKKYSKEPEKFAVAQRELFRKHNHNPFAGCLPIFLQLPIFIGLYNALYYAIDLRLARFLWVDNLAAPDALLQFPGPLPFVGWHEFNLLPILTCGLFLVQQKMFLPPAETDEQRMTNRMMNFMTVFMGFMFYKSPAGLCLYFMASSIWGICERKLLDRMKPQIEARNEAKKKILEEKRKARGENPKGPSWLERLAAAADDARKQSANQKLTDSKKESRRR